MNELSDDERNLNRPPDAGSSVDLRDLHVLLVEDSPDIGELVKTFLELEGTTVAGPATTAEEGLWPNVGRTSRCAMAMPMV